MLNSGGEKHTNNLAMFRNRICHLKYIKFEAMIESSDRNRLEPFFFFFPQPTP